MSARVFAAFIAVCAVVGLLAYGLLSKGESALALGEPAPDKELSVLGGEGTGKIADYRDQWVLVNFWASWCEPCRDEAPALEAFQKQHAPGATVLGINLDDATDDAEKFVAEYGLTYPQLRDGDGRERRDEFGMTGFPESFLVDPNGNLALIRRGPVTEQYLNETVAKVIQGR